VHSLLWLGFRAFIISPGNDGGVFSPLVPTCLLRFHFFSQSKHDRFENFLREGVSILTFFKIWLVRRARSGIGPHTSLRNWHAEEDH